LHSINSLAQIGQLPQGGVRRLAFSAEDVAARLQVTEWMQQAGLAVRIDAAGNLIGRYGGQDPQAAALATGSHLDTVPTGGCYDGSYGVLAGLEVVRVLQEKQMRLRHPLEVIVFSDEEGTMIGSKAMSGQLSRDPSTYSVADGTSIQACLQQIGGDWEGIAQVQRSRDQIAAFVELHVEQGPVLQHSGCQIGVVTGIVGQQRQIITVTGLANHAGTTPMSMRQDALVAAAQLILFVHQLACNTPGDHVATVGSLQVFPNAANVVPGKVEMSLDMRDLCSDHLASLIRQVQQEMDRIASQTQTQFQWQPRLQVDPAPASPTLQTTITQVCRDLGYSHHLLPSRASHDAQDMARITDMGMIFVPSQGGISHNESEFTPSEDCVRGANVLLHTLLRLDQLYP
jgi:N-carbamoyl-L-amino-acid hydrolase